jgi:hypothetical protein
MEIARTAQFVAGGTLYGFAILDMFSTVLYPRLGRRGVAHLGAGWIASAVGHCVRRPLLLLSKLCGGRDALLSMTGPLTVLLLAFAWAALLTTGTALMVHPLLGESLISRNPPPYPTFAAAVSAATGSLALGGTSDFTPATDGTRLAFAVNAWVGTAVVSLTLTYLLQVYTALRQRNSVAASLHLYSRSTGDAACVVASLLPKGTASLTSSNLSGIGQSIIEINENYHFYPVLFFFHPANVYRSDARFTMLVLDAASLMRTAVSQRALEDLRDAASVILMRDATTMLMKTIESAYLDGVSKPRRPDAATEAAWRRRFREARDEFARAGIPVEKDAEAAAARYVDERSQWQPGCDALGVYMQYRREEVDPATWCAGERKPR